LLGEAAATYCCTAKRMRSRVFPSPSTLSARPISVRAFSRYSRAVNEAIGLSAQAAPLKRRSPSGSGAGRAAAPFDGAAAMLWFHSALACAM
jgi:hypothetical protein